MCVFQCIKTLLLWFCSLSHLAPFYGTHNKHYREHVETLEVDACMVATGRVPNTKNMGLEDRGIEMNRGFVAVNERMQVLTKAGDGGDVTPMAK